MLVTRSRAAGGGLNDLFADVRLMHAGQRFSLFEARDDAAGRAVTLKLATDDLQWLNDVIAREATVLAALARAPYVVGLYERVELDDGRPVLVLQHCVDSLADLLGHDGAGTKMPAPAAVALGIKIATALEAVHATNVLHRDVRPENILVTAAGEPMLAGFDEASHVGDAGEPLHVMTGHTAPEVLEGNSATARSDVYGLASTLYELLAGQAAFRAYAGESAATVIVRALSGRVKPLVEDGVPLALSDLLTWAMSADPAARPPSAAWLAEELSQLEGRMGWPRTVVSG